MGISIHCEEGHVIVTNIGDDISELAGPLPTSCFSSDTGLLPVDFTPASKFVIDLEAVSTRNPIDMALVLAYR